MLSKKAIYVLLTMFLGVLLSGIVHGLIEIWLIKGTLSSVGVVLPKEYVSFGGHCFLPPFLQLTLLLLGLVGGYFLGQTWWRIVYIEHRHWKKGKFWTQKK